MKGSHHIIAPLASLIDYISMLSVAFDAHLKKTADIVSPMECDSFVILNIIAKIMIQLLMPNISHNI